MADVAGSLDTRGASPSPSPSKSRAEQDIAHYLSESKRLLTACREDLYECIRLQTFVSSNPRTSLPLAKESIVDAGITVDYSKTLGASASNRALIPPPDYEQHGKTGDDDENDDDSDLSADDEDQVKFHVSPSMLEAAGDGVPVVPAQAFLDELSADNVELLLHPGESKPAGPLPTLIRNEWEVKVLKPAERREMLKRQETQRIKQMHRQKSEQLDKVLKIAQPEAKTGYMIKVPTSTGKPFARPKSRWFVLSGRVLVYLAHKQAQVPRKMIDLAGADVQAVKAPRGPTGFEVRLRTVFEDGFGGKGLKNYRFCTKTPEEALEWQNVLKNNISYADQEDAKKHNPKVAAETDVTNILNDFSARRQSRVGIDITAKSQDSASKSYYDLLGIAPSATDAALKKSYRALAMDYHPDKNQDINPDEFAAISRAYAVLKDPETRKEYDLSQRVKSALRRGVIVMKHDVVDKTEEEVAEKCRQRLTEVYEEQDPSRLRHVDSILKGYEGKEEELYRLIEEKYGGFPEEEPQVTSSKQVCFLDEAFSLFIWQAEEHGQILQAGYGSVELRYVQKVLFGEDYESCVEGLEDRLLVIAGTRMGCPDIVLELDTTEARDELVQGLRILRCADSMLFTQNLAKMKAEGLK